MKNTHDLFNQFPCKICLVSSICKNFDCPIVEFYLTYYHNTLSLLTVDEIKTYRNSTDPDIKKIMNYFSSKKTDRYGYEYPIYIKKRGYLICLVKDYSNREIQSIKIKRQ